LIGSLFVFFLIKFVNKHIKDDECLLIGYISGWWMLMLVVMSWLGLLTYIVFELMVLIDNISRKCKDKNELYNVLYKLNEFVERVFR
jgi:hypothetical protein